MSDENRIVKKEEQMETADSAIDPRVQDPGFWREIWEQVRLVWLLLKDKEVPIYMKLLPVAALIYVILPVDLIPEILVPPPFGQLDDLTAVLFGAKLFIEMAPQDIVNRHIRAMRMQIGHADLDGIDQSDKEIDASIVIEGDFEQVENTK